MANIGGNDLIPKVVSKVIWYWTDDEGQLYTNKFDTVLRFPDSQFNILSTTALAESMKNDEGIWVLKKIKFITKSQ